MKLKDSFIIQDVGGDMIAVPIGAAAEDFHGILRLNETASFIMESLRTETTEEGLLDSLQREYRAEREKAALDMRMILERLRSIHALEE